MLRRLPLYPFLIAIWPPLALAAKNLSEVWHWMELVPPIAVGLGVCGTTLLVTSVMRMNAASRGVAMTLAGLTFWFYRPMAHLVSGSPLLHSLGLGARPGMVIVVMATGLALLAAPRLIQPWARSTRVLNTMAAILVLLAIRPLAMHGFRPDLAARLGPRPAATHAAVAATPDVYLLLLDSYGDPDAIQRLTGLDGRPFLDSLRARGFVVPANPRANYLWTTAALASMLNWDYLTELTTADLGAPTAAQEVLFPLIADNRTLRTFIAAGYEFVFVPSMVPFANHHPWADRTLAAGVTRHSGEFRAHWPKSTPIPEWRRSWCRLVGCTPRLLWTPESAAAFDRKFAELGALRRVRRPMFVLAHILLPHEPFVYDSDCSPRAAIHWPQLHQMDADSVTLMAYRSQVACLNSHLLNLLSAIQAKPGPESIVVLQSDHGPRFGLNRAGSVDGATTDQLMSWFGIFAAYRVPEGWAHNLNDQVTPVNALRTLFSQVSGTPLPPVVDRSYLSVEGGVYLFESVPRDRLLPRE